MSSKFFVSYNSSAPVATRATSIEGAKRAAARNCIFQGCDLFVMTKSGDEFVTVAKKMHRDALDMSAVGKWQEA